ncbi:hypothetical protein [Lysobacter niastensis]|uniref:Uncharacterized protein n=1 Tax=Lysobacter niastensis TaxID=380629 RepID=A0ABS0B648_9GAMM|nr:hypothetical protein [Lysobacter niastensis]MBF6024475.1 hypothetical protein [Lysobacter niastensis]
MNPDPRSVAGVPAPRDARDAAALGAELVAQVDLDAIGAHLANLPTAALLSELEGIAIAIDNADPARRRRRAGFFGRLLGRDLVAQAQPDPADTRVRLHLSSAQALAERLAAKAAELEPLAAWLREQSDRLRAVIDSTSADADSEPTLARRRVHLGAIAATWDTTVRQVELMHQHVRHLLMRHAQVRDLLVPAWRQQALLTDPSARDEAETTARLQDTLRSQLAALREALRGENPNPDTPDTLRNATPPAGIDAGRANKESSS